MEADEGAAEGGEGEMDVGAPLVGGGEAAEAGEQGERAFQDRLGAS